MKKSMMMLAALAVTMCGCVGPDVAKSLSALGDDHATVRMDLTTPWGTQRVVRTNPGTNQTVSISADGSMTVTGAK